MQFRAPHPLESWKEIAVFIGRDERTAMRWAKHNGMPVHRVPGGKRGHVFAYPEEIGSWLNSSPGGKGTITSGNPQGNPAPTPKRNGYGFWKIAVGWFTFPWWQWIAVSALIVTASGAAGLIHLRAGAAPVLRLAGSSIVTNDLRPIRGLRTDGKTLYYTITEGLRNVLLSVPIDGGTPHEIEAPFANTDVQDLSSDGKYLLVNSREGIEADKPLWEMPASGGVPRRIGDVTCSSALWSPGAERITFTKAGQVWLVNRDGSGPRLLASFPGSAALLAWKPDGSILRLLVEDLRGRKYTFWDVPVPDGEETQALRPIHLADAAAGANGGWIDNGKEFASVDLTFGETSILRVTDGNQSPWRTPIAAANLPLRIGRITAMAAPSQGRDLYFVTDTADEVELLRYDKKLQLFPSFLPGSSRTLISFSRDGKWMAYVDEATRSLWRSRVNGTDGLQLTKPGMNVELSAWAPDGSRIAFMGTLPGTPPRIYLVSSNGGELRQAVSGDIAQGAPSWSPDGHFLVYGKVYCQDTHTCELRRITLDSGRDEPVEGSPGLRTARWSYDGKYIAALNPEQHELLLMNVKDGRWKVLADNVTGDNLSWSQDSQFIYVDSPQSERPVIERVHVSDGHRSVAVSLSLLQKLAGRLDNWFALAPDDSPIVARLINSSQICSLHLTAQ